MNQNHKKLEMNIKGSIQQLYYKYKARRLARKLGLVTHKMEANEMGHLEIIVEGEKAKLWEMIEWCKRGPILMNVEEVVVRFQPVEISA